MVQEDYAACLGKIPTYDESEAAAADRAACQDEYHSNYISCVEASPASLFSAQTTAGRGPVNFSLHGNDILGTGIIIHPNDQDAGVQHGKSLLRYQLSVEHDQAVGAATEVTLRRDTYECNQEKDCTLAENYDLAWSEDDTIELNSGNALAPWRDQAPIGDPTQFYFVRPDAGNGNILAMDHKGGIYSIELYTPTTKDDDHWYDCSIAPGGNNLLQMLSSALVFILRRR
jgi:hypothetical protein